MTIPNRYGEDHIRPDYYEDKSGVRHSLIEDLEHSINWSQDTRSEASQEKHPGYVRSDGRILEEVYDALKTSPELDASEIGVTVDNGIVTLLGKVSGSAEKRKAEIISVDVPGVLEVRNEIVVS